MQLKNMPMELVLLCLILVFELNFVSACSCRVSHPQQHFCHSDFVIQAKVLKSSPRSTVSFRGIHIKIKKYFKMSEKARLALKSNMLWTAGEESLCGISLKPDHKYVISGKLIGKKAWISLCDYVVEWTELTRKQRKGFRMLYKHGCNCKIRACPEYAENCNSVDGSGQSRTTCLWTSLYDGRYDCQSLHTYCVPHNDKTCRWAKSEVFEQCLRQRDKAKLRQRLRIDEEP